jgi:hydroxymethylpyrimidine/phosphomethylpyrimidine kinase
VTPPVVLTIAGSDSGAGAGIQADVKTFAALGCYGTSVITAVTAQNTKGVPGIFPMSGEAVAAQLDALLDDLPPRAVKVGMLATVDAAVAVADRARAGLLPNLVVDPVLVSTSGYDLGAVEVVELLLPHALVLTPNLREASALVGWPVTTVDDMARAAGELAARGPQYVVVTGGDVTTGDEAVDVVCAGSRVEHLRLPRVATRNNHGTGCTFSAAIAARLALGDAVPNALAFAKDYVTRALRGSREWALGGGHGPLDHFGWSAA